MPLDRRLREGLERSSTAIEERSLDHVLDGVVARGRRRRLVRRLAAGTLAFAAVLAALFLAPKALDAIRSFSETKPASPQQLLRQIAGTYTIQVHPSSGAIEAFDLTGTWTIGLLRTGAMEITPPPQFLRSWDPPSGDVFTVEGNSLRTNAFVRLCASSIGTYTWVLGDDRLTLKPLSEDCKAREALLTASAWVRR